MATISELSAHSLTLFKELALLEGLSRHEKEIPLQAWQDEICRLQVWVRNTGANEVGQLSMESRLMINLPLLYRQIVKLFERIQELLTDLKEVLDEDLRDNVNDYEYGESTEESEEDIGDGFNIQHIHKSLREMISYLNKMTTAILRVPYDDEVAGRDKLQAHATSDTPPLASSLLLLTKIALQTSQSLYNILSTQVSDRTSHELCEGLAALNSTLEGLQDVDFEHEATLTSLKLPLCHCAKVCREFQGIICSDQKHFTGWAEPGQRQIDSHNLKIALSEYEATISIALGLVTLQKSKATTTVIDEYREMISKAEIDLSNHLKRLDDKLVANELPKVPVLAIDHLLLDKMTEERECIQQCIKICSWAHTYINGNEARPPNITTAEIDEPGLGGTVVSNAAHIGALVDEKRQLSAGFESQAVPQLHGLNDKIKFLSEQKPQVSDEDKKQLKKFKEERDMLTQALSMVAEAGGARTYSAVEDTVSESESQRIVVATLGDLISAKRISARPKESRLLGQLSDDPIQKLDPQA